MNIILIPHLPKFSTRGYQLAKHLTNKGNIHFIMWDMPFPLTVNNIWYNIINSWKYTLSTKDRVTIHKIKRLPFFFPIINKWWFKKQINEIYNKYDIQFILSESYFNETEPPLDLPIVYDLVDDHEAFIEIYGSPIYKWGCKILEVKKTIKNQILVSKKTLAVSDLLIDYVKKFNKVAIKIPNGVSDFFLNYSTRNVYKKHSLVYVSNFDKFSNLNNVVYAINSLATKYNDINLNIVGDGSEIADAKNLVRTLKLEKYINFTGWINHNDVPEIINTSEVSLLPFKKDRLTDSSFPIKILEYLSVGNKIVSVDLSEVKLLKSSNIYTYSDDEKYKNLTKAIDLAFKSKLQSDVNRRTATKYSWDKICDKLQLITNDK